MWLLALWIFSLGIPGFICIQSGLSYNRKVEIFKRRIHTGVAPSKQFEQNISHRAQLQSDECIRPLNGMVNNHTIIGIKYICQLQILVA